MAEINSNFLHYLIILGKRIYRPVKPVTDPLLNKLKISYVLTGLIVLAIGGSFWPEGRRYQAQERAAWWPWSTKAHSQMALAWFENGNEEKALEELNLAKKLFLFQSPKVKDSLSKAEKVVNSPSQIRQEIKSWEKVLDEKPSYKDVLLRLSLLNFKIYEVEKANFYWQKAEYLDPNNKEVQKVGKVIFPDQP